MKRFFRTRFDKPQLGTPLAAGNLSIGLQLACVLNEYATGGPDSSGTLPAGHIYNLIGRNHGTGTGILGPSAQSNRYWKPSSQGIGFCNQSAAQSGAIDFGPVSNFPAFSNKFSVFVGAAFPNVSSSVNRAFVIVNPGGNSEHLGVVATTTGKWSLEYVDSGGTGHFVQISPSHQTNHAWIDFLGMTFDGANLKGYINGILGGTAATSGTFAPLSTDHVYLGGWMGASGGNFFNNPITVAYMWNRVLSPAEIQQLYLDPYWALVPKNYSYRTGLPVIPPTPTLQIRGSSNTQGRYGKSGIKQRVITVPEMYSFEEVRQAMAKALNDLQVHIASQLPISNYQGQNISNVGPPVAADDVVTLRYLQSVYVPPLTGTKT